MFATAYIIQVKIFGLYGFTQFYDHDILHGPPIDSLYPPVRVVVTKAEAKVLAHDDQVLIFLAFLFCFTVEIL